MRLRSALLWVAGTLAALGLTLLVLVESGWGPLHTADRALSHRLHRVALNEPGLTHANRILTDWVWDPVTTRLLALATIVALVLNKARRLAAWAAVTFLAGLVVQYGIRAAVARSRPAFPDPVDSAQNWGFPSGHVMAATVTAGLLLTLLVMRPPARAAWGIAAWVVALVSVVGVGFTRVFLGVHWPTDVLAGWLFGAAVVTACIALLAPTPHQAGHGFPAGSR